MALLALVAAGCGSDGAGSSADATSTSSGSLPPSPTVIDAGSSPPTGAPVDPGAVHEVGSYLVGRADLELVDGSRPTKAHGDQPELASRTLPTMVLYPAVDGAVRPVPEEGPTDGGADGPATTVQGRSSPDEVAVVEDAAAVGEPAPLIVFGHGSTRAGPDYLDTLAAWASAGYVVAAPNFPLSTTGAPGGTDYGGIAEQTGDVSFVIDEVLAASADPDDRLSGTVDPERIGLGGQSFGAITAIATGYNACCADERIDALTEFAGMWFDLGDGEAVAAAGADLPGLFVHGDGDGVVPIEGDAKAAELAAAAGAPVQFLELATSDHDAGFFGGPDGTALDRLVTAATLAWYDQHLKDDDAAADRLAATVDDAGGSLATLEPIGG